MPKKLKSAVPLECQLADLAITEPDLFDVLQQPFAEALWNKLVAEFTSKSPEYDWSQSKRVAAWDQIQRALPKNLKGLSFSYHEAQDTYTNAKEQAAYLIGLEVGRRIAGGAR